MTVRLTADDERGIATRILELERLVRHHLGRIEACTPILVRRGRRTETTRAGKVARLAEALDFATALAEAATDPDTDTDLDTDGLNAIAAAELAWAEAQGLRWTLALSATYVAHREAHRLVGNPVLMPGDLVQEGMAGLLRAAIRFEPDRGHRFATYARWWARANMTRAIDQARIVTMSNTACEQLRNLRKAIRTREASGEPGTPAELAADAGVDVDRAALLLSQGHPTSIESEADEGDEAPITRLELVDGGPTPHDAANEREQAERLQAALRDALPARMLFVVVHRFGIGRDPETLSSIARRLGLSRERVRQLERDALILLRDDMERRPAIRSAS